MPKLTEEQRAVLNVYVELAKEDPEGAFAPYYIDVARAAGNDVQQAYLACRELKKMKLLDCVGRQGPRLFDAPGYWPTPAGEAEIAGAS